MVKVVLEVPPDLSSDEVINTFIAKAESLGLQVKEMVPRTYRGSTHWHLTLPNHKGTLEATWRPASCLFWLSIHDNRRADWQAEILLHLGTVFGIHAEVAGVAEDAEGEGPA